MSSGNTNNKSAKKNIRFPHELIDGIDASVEQEKLTNPSANFFRMGLRCLWTQIKNMNSAGRPKNQNNHYQRRGVRYYGALLYRAVT